MSGRILLGHGSGGSLSGELLRDVFLGVFQDPELLKLEDQATLASDSARICLTTDSYVVDPLEFRGGDIGSLAVHGTVNDLSVGGAEPRWMSVAFILEEGLEIEVLKRILGSMAEAASSCGVAIVTGDTKVVPSGKADRMFINTTGVGILPQGRDLGAGQIRPGDVVLLSGTLADHGVTIMAEREGLRLGGDLRSDSAPLWDMVKAMMDASPQGIHAMRDPTRGGLASTVNELAVQAGMEVELDATAIPILPSVESACELLGLDPLQVANEGKLVAFVDPDHAEGILQAMASVPEGDRAARIGVVREAKDPKVLIRTEIGGLRIVPLLSGDLLPRIC